MTHSYMFRIFRHVDPQTSDDLDHLEVATYANLAAPPWVPPTGSYFRFRDPYPPNRPTDHREIAGHVGQVVTLFYGTSTTIEIYLKDVRIS